MEVHVLYELLKRGTIREPAFDTAVHIEECENDRFVEGRKSFVLLDNTLIGVVMESAFS